MLGYTGSSAGTRVSVQASGMGCPSAAIVIEELVQLGVKRFLRVGTCGGLQPDLELGDLIVALSARPGRRAPRGTTSASEPHAPDRRLGARPRGGARREGARQAGPRRRDRLERHLLQPRRRAAPALVGARDARGRDGGGGAVHARRPAQGPDRLPADRRATSSSSGEFTRISDEDLRAAVDRMTELALRDRHDGACSERRHGLPRQPRVGERRDRPALARARAQRRRAGLRGDALFSERPGHLRELAREAADGRRAPARGRRRRRHRQRGRERASPGSADVELAVDPARAPAATSSGRIGIPRRARRRRRRRAPRRARATIDLGRASLPRAGRARAARRSSPTSRARA